MTFKENFKHIIRAKGIQTGIQTYISSIARWRERSGRGSESKDWLTYAATERQRYEISLESVFNLALLFGKDMTHPLPSADLNFSNILLPVFSAALDGNLRLFW